jgi:type VI secretion system protein ImpL
MYAGEVMDVVPKLGPYFNDVFEVRDEEELLVPAIHTVGGYQTVNFGANSEAMMGWMDDRWVLGEEGIPNPMELASISDGVKRLYSTEYIAVWQSLLGDIDLLVPTDTGQLSDTLGQLSESALSPMSALLKLVSEETSLPDSNAMTDAAAGAAAELAKRKTGNLGRAADKIASSGVIPDAFDIPAEVSRAFAPYHDMLRGGASSRDARVAMQISDVRQWLNMVQDSPDSATSNNPSRKLLMTAEDLAAPFSGWVASLAQSAQNTAKNRKVGQLNSRWQSEVVTPCKRSFDNKFPFSSTAKTAVSLADFEDFFAPEGIEDSFVKEYLEPLIKKQDGTVSRGTVWSIRQAERIREAFFANGNDFGFTYSLLGVEVDDRIGQLVIESGTDQRVRFRHGPPVPMELDWPDGDRGLKITFMLKDGSSVKHVIAGPWAIFRAVASARADSGRSAGVDSVLVSFSDGGYKAIFRLTSESRINPFLPGLLDKYSCRSRL